jgi:ABC-2 type transport system ATP-binding protein
MPAAEPLAIEVRGLTRRYGDRVAVDHLNLAIPEGAVYGFLGPNGAGKSTTFKMLCGLLAATSGEARVLGLSISKQREELKRAIGFMPQSCNLHDHLTVEENIAFYASLYVPGFRKGRERVAELLERTGLDERRKQQAGALSGGWRQRVALACAVVHEPRVLFLDEPTVGVDPISRRVFWDLLHELNEQGTTLFVTTHYMEEVERCSLVGLLVEGRLRLGGSPHKLRQLAESKRELIAVRGDEPERSLRAVQRAEGLLDAYLYGGALHLAWARGADGAARAARALHAASVRAAAIEPRPAILEDVFALAAGGA